MKCTNFRIRSKNYNKIFYCALNKKEIQLNDCNNCPHKVYKFVKPMNNTTPLKKVTKKQAKAEKNRFSVFTDDLTKSIESKLPKDDLHEIFGGRNRHNSIKWALVIPLTREEHQDPAILLKWKLKAQEWFVKEYGYDKFMEVFKIDYIEKHKKKTREINP